MITTKDVIDGAGSENLPQEITSRLWKNQQTPLLSVRNSRKGVKLNLQKKKNRTKGMIKTSILDIAKRTRIQYL